jgi:hypothetical protein
VIQVAAINDMPSEELVKRFIEVRSRDYEVLIGELTKLARTKSKGPQLARDIGDGKFGRGEGTGLDRALIGWAQQGVSDEELLRRGIELIEGLYHSIGD